jgi:iron complex transport system substrate-binding protein
MPRLLLFFAGLLFLCTMGLAAQANAPVSAASPAMHEVVDGYGRTVRIPVNPVRIVSLAPSLTETIYALGVDERLVGDTDYCDYPPEAKKKTKVGGVINPNLEQIAVLHPDLVLVTKEGNRLETVRALDTLGIPTYATDVHTIDEIISSTQKLSDILNVSTVGKALADDLQRRLASLQSRLANLPPKRVLFVVWTEPLISAGRKTFIADALTRAGAISIVDSSQDWPQMNLEEVARLQPEYLVFAASHTGDATHDFEVLANRPDWRTLQAVRNRHFAIVSDAVNRPSPGIVSVIEDLARQLHPEAFQELPAQEKSPTSRANELQFPHPQPLSHQTENLTSPAEYSCAR